MSNQQVHPAFGGVLRALSGDTARSCRATGNHCAAQNDEPEPGDLTREDLAAIDAEFAPAPYSEEWLAQADKEVQQRKDDECRNLTRACDEREMRRSTFGSELDRATWMRNG